MLQPSSSAPLASDVDIFLIGMRRSGIHGVVSWLLPHLQGMTRLINDPVFLPAKGLDPLAGQPTRYYFTHGGRTSEAIMQHEAPALFEQFVRDTAELYLKSAPSWLSPLAASVMRKYRRHRQAGGALRKPAFPFDGSDGIPPVGANLFVLENITPREFAEVYPRWKAEDYAPWLAKHGMSPSRRSVILLLLRDPWNQLASVLKLLPLAPPRPVPPEQFQATWLDYAREMTGATQLLGAHGELVPVLYSRWFAEQPYRAELASKLGVAPTDAGLNLVADFGGGSSFEGRGKTGKAQDMKVSERWRGYENHPLMRELCGNPEVRDLSRRIFGTEAPEIKA